MAGQVYSYWCHFSDDNRAKKSMVSADNVRLFSTSQVYRSGCLDFIYEYSANNIAMSYRLLLLDVRYVCNDGFPLLIVWSTRQGNASTLHHSVWSLSSMTLLEAVIGGPVQIFFAWRIWTRMLSFVNSSRVTRYMIFSVSKASPRGKCVTIVTILLSVLHSIFGIGQCCPPHYNKFLFIFVQVFLSCPWSTRCSHGRRPIYFGLILQGFRLQLLLMSL